MLRLSTICLLFLTTVAMIMVPAPDSSGANPPEGYALFICGGMRCSSSAGGNCPGVSLAETPFLMSDLATPGWWADIMTWINLLTDEYCYEPDHMYLCWTNGVRASCAPYDESVDFDNINLYLATKDSVVLAFDRIKERADSNDMLFVYICGHGACWNDNYGSAVVCLAGGDSPEGNLRDYELGALVDSVECSTKIVVANTCFCGGLIDELVDGGALVLTANDYRVAHSVDDYAPKSTSCQTPGGDAGDPREIDACGGSSFASASVYHGEHTYHLLNALRGKTVRYENPVAADFDGNGWTTFAEAQAYACTTNSCGTCDGGTGCHGSPPENQEKPQIGWATGMQPGGIGLGGRIDLASGPLCKRMTVWSDTVTITGDVSILEGDTLVVRPGAVILCDSLDDRASGADTENVEIIVYGALLAEGTAQSPIRFTSRLDPAPGTWGEEWADDTWRGIRFEPGSEGILGHCTVRRAYYAVECDSADPTIEYSSIVDNHMAGIRCTGTAAPTISDADSIARSFRGIICMGHSAPIIQGTVVDTCNVGILAQGESTPVIHDCRIKRCVKGISCAASSAPEIGPGCDIYLNGDAGISLDLNVDTDITIDSCDVRDNDTYGILCRGSSGVSVSRCEIFGNAEGIVSLEDADCLLGSASPEEAGYNNIYDNDDHNVRNSTTGGDTLRAENCWWGSATPDTSKISGPVDYEPYLTDQVELAPAPFLRGIVSASDEMASLGRVFPAPAREYASIPYFVRAPGARVRISIANVQGQEVKVLVDRWLDPGQHSVTWDVSGDGGRDLPSGIYFCILRTESGGMDAAKIAIVGQRKSRSDRGTK